MINKDAYNYRELFFLDKFMMGHKGFIAGGCFKNIFNKEKVRDLDIFFLNQEDFHEAKKYYENKIKESPDKFRFFYENKNTWAVYLKEDGIRLELIRSVYGTPGDIVSDFDFTVTKFVYYRDYSELDEEDYRAVFKVCFHEDFFEHLMQKRLVIDNNIPFPVSTFNRTYKYAGYGFMPCRETKVKLIQAIHSLEEVDDDMLDKGLYFGKD